MTEQERMIWIEDCIHSGQKRMPEIKAAENEATGLEQYKLSVAHRMMTYWFKYRENHITAQDFSSSLRSYLLVWNTDIALPDFKIEPGNPYGLMQNAHTGRIYVNYQTPDYFNDYFLKAAYMQGSIENRARKIQYDLRTSPFVYALTGFFRYKSMEQKLAVSGALKSPDGYTTLIAMLTGGGKSLVTQTIAYQKENGLTLVIVPTISLMIDQERNAKKNIRSDVSDEIFSYYSGKDLTSFYDALKRKRARLLFVSPEALMKNQKLRETLLQSNAEHYIKNLIIDEAHIVIEWGASFRVDYQCLDSFQRNLLIENQELRTFLMSATYSKDTVQQLRHFYSDGEKWIEIRCDRLRREPRYSIIKASSYIDRRRKLEVLAAILPRPMIIYVNSPETASKVQKHLQECGITNTHTFTGLTPNKERERLIAQWANQDFDLMIATCAFGVGVDKKDVRTVLHLYVPENPNKYYQEAGRGGRDGLPCLGVMLYTEEDVNTAFQRMQKVLTTDKLSGRWFSMLHSQKTVRNKYGEILIDTSIKPDYNDKDGFFSDVSDIDISWNVYVLLLLRRNYLIDILDVSYQENRYIFKIRLCEHEIGAPSEEATARFENIRTSEWTQILREFDLMRNALRHVGRECWSEMFNEVYNLTEAYCSGCDHHNEIVNEESTRMPLLLKLPALNLCRTYTVNEMMDGADEMLVIANASEQMALTQKMLKSGIENIVFPQNSITLEQSMQYETANRACLLMNLNEFFDFCSRGQYYVSGSILLFLPEEEYSVLRILEAVHRLRSSLQSKIILVASEDYLLAKRGKRLSELVDGPYKQAYIILEG